MKKPSRPIGVLNIRSMPLDLRDQFKAWCAKRGYSMERAIICLVYRAIKENKPLPGAASRYKIRGSQRRYPKL